MLAPWRSPTVRAPCFEVYRLMANFLLVKFNVQGATAGAIVLEVRLVPWSSRDCH
jgi:hypothetical protein